MPYFQIVGSDMSPPTILFHHRELTREQFAAIVARRYFELTGPETPYESATFDDVLEAVVHYLVEKDGFTAPLLDNAVTYVSGMPVRMDGRDVEACVEEFGPDVEPLLSALEDYIAGIPSLEEDMQTARQPAADEDAAIFNTFTKEQSDLVDKLARKSVTAGFDYAIAVLRNIRDDSRTDITQAIEFIQGKRVELVARLCALIEQQDPTVADNGVSRSDGQ